MWGEGEIYSRYKLGTHYNFTKTDRQFIFKVHQLSLKIRLKQGVQKEIFKLCLDWNSIFRIRKTGFNRDIKSYVLRKSNLKLKNLLNLLLETDSTLIRWIIFKCCNLDFITINK